MISSLAGQVYKQRKDDTKKVNDVNVLDTNQYESATTVTGCI